MTDPTSPPSGTPREGFPWPDRQTWIALIVALLVCSIAFGAIGWAVWTLVGFGWPGAGVAIGMLVVLFWLQRLFRH